MRTRVLASRSRRRRMVASLCALAVRVSWMTLGYCGLFVFSGCADSGATGEADDSYRLSGTPEEIDQLISIVLHGEQFDAMLAGACLVGIGDKARDPVAQALARCQMQSEAAMFANARAAATSGDASYGVDQTRFLASRTVILEDTLRRIESHEPSPFAVDESGPAAPDS